LVWCSPNPNESGMVKKTPMTSRLEDYSRRHFTLGIINDCKNCIYILYLFIWHIFDCDYNHRKFWASYALIKLLRYIVICVKPEPIKYLGPGNQKYVKFCVFFGNFLCMNSFCDPSFCAQNERLYAFRSCVLLLVWMTAL